MLRSPIVATISAAALLMAAACRREPTPEPTPQPEQAAQPAAAEPSSANLSLARLQELYDKARQAGETMPDDVMEWARGDAARIGDWDYQIVTLNDDSDSALQTQLVSLGSNRWECFWIEPRPDGKRFYLKRPQRSYLLIAGKAAKFIPTHSSGD